jgi:hypothetical protein
MNLPRTGREFAHADIAGLAEDVTLQASLDGAAWVPVTRDGSTVRLLVAGPDAEGNPPGTLVLPLGRSMLTVRAEDNPEVVVRTWGPFTVR